MNVVAGPYYIRVGGFGGATGTFPLNVNGPLGALVQATNASLGAGCGGAFTSFYELFPNSAAFDLANTALTMSPSAGGYVVQPGVAGFVPPSGAATTLALGDDAEVTVPLATPFPCAGGPATSLTVCSNGFVSIASGNPPIWAPYVPNLLGGPATGWYHWHDFNPAIVGGGRVKFEQVGSVACVTWDGVWDYGGTSAADANTFQFQFDCATGVVHLVFLTTSQMGNARLIGYSPGGASADPGSRDISATIAGSFSLALADVPHPTLAASTRPVTGTSWNLAVSGVPAGSALGVDVIGFTDPGLNDLTFLGMPGCGLRASLDVLSVWGITGATHSFAIGIPANPALLNVHLYTTSAVFKAGINPFGAITANGIDGTIGDV